MRRLRKRIICFSIFAVIIRGENVSIGHAKVSQILFVCPIKLTLLFICLAADFCCMYFRTRVKGGGSTGCRGGSFGHQASQSIKLARFGEFICLTDWRVVDFDSGFFLLFSWLFICFFFFFVFTPL